MNVNLPEKEKLSKNAIIIYFIVALVCIFAIIVVIGIQILGDDIINNMFGINKLVKKTEQEELELKTNFMTLFNNNFNNKSEYKAKKINENNDIVYSSYEKTESNEHYELDVKIPYINIKNSTIEKYNEEIIKTFQAKAEEVTNSTNKNTIYSVKYMSYIENNILTLVIYSNLKQDATAQRVIVQTFNFNLENNKELTLEEVLKIYQLDKNDVQNKIKSDIKAEEEKAQALIDLGYNVFTRDIDSDIYKIENSTEFFVHDNNLYILYPYGNNDITSEMDLVII